MFSFVPLTEHPRKMRQMASQSKGFTFHQSISLLFDVFYGKSVSIMPKDQQTHMARGRPISCRFCRARKLRCSREAPCTNCISRGINCDLEPLAQPSSRNAKASESVLLERIRKLEKLLEQKSQATGNIRNRPLAISDTPPRLTQESNVSPEIEHLDNDVAWLASIYSGQDLSVVMFGLTMIWDLTSSNRTKRPQIRLSSRSVPYTKSHKHSLYSIRTHLLS